MREILVSKEKDALFSRQKMRRDFVFKFLVEKTHQFSMFNDEGNPAAIDEPVKDFPLMHFLKLG